MIEADVYAALVAAGRPINSRELSDIMDKKYRVIATALYRMSEKGVVARVSPRKTALWVALPGKDMSDKRGTSPISRKNLALGWFQKEAQLAKFEREKPKAPVHLSPLAQALAWQP